MKHCFLLLFLSVNFICAQTPDASIPKIILPLMNPSSESKMIASVEHQNTHYYLINEFDKETGGQKLIAVKDDQPKVLASDTFLFPLSKFNLPDPVIQEIAKQYVAQEIEKTPNGVAGLQKKFDKSPVPPSTWIPDDLKAAYQAAGIKFKK